MLGTARGGKYDPKVIDLNNLVESSSKMFARTRKDIQIDLSLSKSPITSEVDKQQIEQVLLNMYVNAWQAMGNGGELFLLTTVETLEESHTLEHSGASPGQYSKISITDTGIGMDELTRQQIFDPFFTTKEKGRGTGLGLASAYGIVKNHSGFITVYSEVGHGTTFNIYLPHTTIKPSQETTEQSYIQTGTETVLLVDDESLILEVGQALLEELGYRVIAVNSGAKAIELIDGKSKGIDVVLLDLIMPGLDGRETFYRIREIDSSMPVILSSGYTINEEATDIMRRGCNGFIQKPYNLSALSKKVRSVLDQNNI